MPLNDYDDPEAGLVFPKLQARIQPQKDGTCWIQLWQHNELGGKREVLMNKKIGGSWRDAYENMFNEAEKRNLVIEPDDIEVVPEDNT